MKPLNRPMFRYGGPIKEGIMSGIKEPRQGYNVAGRVLGSVKNFFKPKAPVTGGITATNKGGFFPAMGSKIKQLFTGQKTTTGPGTVTIPAQPGKTIYQGGYSMRVPPSAARTVEKMGPPQVTTQLAPFGTGGPTNQNIYAALQRGIVPTVGATGKVLSAAKPYTGSIVIAGTMYSVLKPDGTPKSVEELSAESGADGNTIVEKVKEKITTGGGTSKTSEELRAEKIQKYRDIMDIKGMNKQAAYDSLIAASQAVNQAGGDLTGAIKDGSLINQIIQSTSKAFDKPKKTKDAIDTLILKGEIEKDIKASDPTNKLLNEYRLKQMEKIDKDLNTGFAEAKIAASKNLSGQAAIDAAASVASENFKGNLLTKTQLTDVMEKAKGSGEISEQDIIIAATTEVIKDKNLPDGDYTVGDVLVTITKGQVTNIKR